MNERILRLAEQAGSTHKQSLGVYQFYEHELEKFAELIVQECIHRINRVGILEDIENETDMVVSAVEDHFGVIS